MKPEIPQTHAVPIDIETRTVVAGWSIDTLESCEDERHEVALAASYCIQYEAALMKAEKEIRRLRMGGAGEPVWLAK